MDHINSFILTGGRIHSLTMTRDYQNVHINRNFILNVFILTKVYYIRGVARILRKGCSHAVSLL